MDTRRFYDIHFHIMDLSHTNITAYLKRLFGFKEIVKSAGRFIHDLFKSIIALNKKSEPSINKTRNLLSFMENSIKYDFLVVENYLKNKDIFVNEVNEFKIEDEKFNKIVLCPLIMDFGYKSLNNDNVFYNIPPQKPITDQISDLFKSINYYYSKDLEIVNKDGITKFNIKDYTGDKGSKLFEIYPFMGLNTKNYTYNQIEEMLNKYFADFSKKNTPEERWNLLYDKMGEFSGDLDNPKDCKNIFAGIKLYPPLGFEPWPEDKKEKNKVELLYRTCIEKNIPLTVHCATGGFDVDKKSKFITDPGNQWAAVLNAYPELKINFAHFGLGSNKWQETLINYMNREGSKVYSDISYLTREDKYYKKIGKLVKSSIGNRLKYRLLFGSDFLINLFHVDSYNYYLKLFSKTKHIDKGIKIRLSNKNSEDFLFR